MKKQHRNQMRILHISPSYLPAYHYGGPTISVSRLAEAQAAEGVQVTVFTTTADGARELEVPRSQPVSIAGLQVWYFPRWTGDQGHLSPGLLWHFWRHCGDFDVVNIHSWWNWVAFGAALICKIKKVKTVVSPHGMLSPYTLSHRRRRWFQKCVGYWLLADATIHATSQQEADEIQKIRPGKPCFVAYNIVVLPPAPLPRKTTEQAPFDLLFISRIHHKKGLELLLEALAGLNENWKLTIAGQGDPAYERQIHKKIKSLGLQEKVYWRGWVQGDEKWPLLAGADLMVLPSYNENFANVVVESLAVGTPVLLSDRVGLRHYVEKRDFGWVVPRQVDALRAALQTALSDSAKRLRIAQTAPSIIVSDFSSGTVVARYLTFYKAL